MIASAHSRSPWGAFAVLMAAIAPAPMTAQTASVTPDGATLQVQANRTGQVASFTLTSGSSSSQTYSLEWVCYDAASACSRVGGSSVTFTYTTPIDITFSTGAPGSGKVVLRAYGPSGSDTGYYNVAVVSYGVAVTPDGGTAAARQANTGGFSETFTVQNTGTASNTYSFACSGTGGVTCGTVPAPVPLGPSPAQTPVSMPYSVGAPGTGTLTLTATGTNASDAGSYSVPIVSYGVSVTPDGAAAPSRPQNTTGYTAVFTVRNTGTGSNTYTLGCSTSGPVTCTGLTITTAPLGAGAQTVDTATYNVSAPGNGTLTLTATGTNASDAGYYTVQVMTFVPSTVTGGVFTKDSHYLLQETANAYDSWGRITQLADARSKVTNYTYGPDPATRPFLTQVQRVADPGGTNLVTDIGYDTDGYVSSIKDEGGGFRYFTYDLYGRLRQIKIAVNPDTVVQAYGYTYSRTSANGWAFQPASPNAVVDSTFQAPGRSLVHTEYVDGLGRPIQSVERETDTRFLVAATQYDAMGRIWRQWKPYPGAAVTYDANFATNAASYYNAYHGTTDIKAYVETQYTPDALARAKQVIPAYAGSAPTSVVHAYGVVVAPDNQQYTEITDEAGKKRRTYTDAFGNNVKTILGYGASEATTTTFAYNILGQRTKATDPRNLNTSYTLDTRGLLTSKTNPDAGTSSHKYDKGGNLRFTQDANQAAAGQVYFTNYDFANRPLTSGQGAATFASLDPDVAAAFEATNSNWLVVRQYDTPPTNVFPWSQFWAQISLLSLTNVSGRLSGLASKSNGAGTSLFYHWYDYDDRGLLWKVFASTSGTKPATPDVTDTYRPNHQPADYQFQGGPLVPLKYTPKDELRRIGDPATTTYPFSASYAFFANGTVSSAEIYSAGSPHVEKRYKYAFTYDAIQRLTSADYSGWSGSAWVTEPNYDLPWIGYDRNGNVTGLQRNRQDGTRIDDLSYGIGSSSNRLYTIVENAPSSPSTEAWDAEAAASGSFTYDPNGNLKTAPDPYFLTAVTYDHQNLPITLTRSGTTTTYRYDDAGQRITKQVGAGNTEVYLREGATTLSVFTVNSAGTPVSWYFNVLAGDKVVGRQPNTGTRSYYHTDLLGSTRAVVQGVTVVESYDFDPWGLLMPGRTLGSGTKEGFTGKEQDAETGLDYFGARDYMAALARWAGVDPLADEDAEWSPYTYVQNNPISLVDPSGLTCVKVHDELQCDDIKPEDINDISAFLGQDLGQFKDGGQSDQGTAQGGCQKYGNCTQSQGGRQAWQESVKTEQPLIAESANTFDVATGIFGALRGLGRVGFGALFGRFATKAALRGTLTIASEEAFERGVLTPEVVSGFRIVGTKGLVGRTFQRNIAVLEAVEKGGTPLRGLVQALEKEAAGAGATELRIVGHGVINPGFLNPAVAQRFGFTFRRINESTVELVKSLP